MPMYATNKAGEYGVPGFGVFRAGETREVPPEVAAQLRRKPEFAVRADGAEDYQLRGADGKVRYLGYTGPVDSRFGYGGGGILILRALTQLGVRASVNPHYNSGHTRPYLKDLPPEAAQHLQNRDVLPQVDLVHCLPDDLKQSLAPRKVAWTMWESDKIPDGSQKDFGDWAALINSQAERLVVPCAHNAAVFAACGVSVPITVLPYGLDTDIWPYFERPERDTFTVVQYGDLTARKGPLEAVEAFQMAFPTETNVRLILKTAANRFHYATGILPEFRDPRIQIVNATWERRQLVELLHQADAFIWLSRGEGFGLPPMQALLTGLPVITTTHTGMGAWYNSRYAEGVQASGMSPSPLGGDWIEPDVGHAAEQLRKVYENRKAALKKAKAGAAYIRREFSLDAFAGRLGAFLETL